MTSNRFFRPTGSAGAHLNLFNEFRKTGLTFSALTRGDDGIDKDAIGTSVTIRSSNAPWQVIYGETRVGGIVSFVTTDTDAGGEFIHLVVTIAGHEVEDVTALYLDDTLVTFTGGDPTGWAIGNYANLVFMSKECLGGHSAANSDLVAQSIALFPAKWTEEHKQLGRAHIYLILKFDATIFPHGLPKIQFQVKGHNQIYDPRGPSTGYSQNAALIINHYITDTSYGLGATYSTRIDESNLIEAADICEEQISILPSGTEDRYQINGAFEVDESPQSILSKMASAIGGDIVYSDGLWRIYPGKWRSPTLTLTEDDLRSPINMQTKVSMRDNFNAIKGQYVSSKNNYEVSDFPAVTNSLYEAQDGGARVYQDIVLALTQSSSAAQRISKIELERIRQGITIEATFGLRAYKALPKNNIQLNLSRFGWDKNVPVAKFVAANTERLTIADNAALSITGAMTISAWIRLASVGTTDKAIVGKWVDAGNQSYVFRVMSTNRVNFSVSSNGTASANASPTTTLAANTWYHVVARYDGTDIRVYINNGTPTTTAYTSGIYDSTADFFLGGYNTGSTENFNGQLRNVGIWGTALDSLQIEELYNNGYPVSYEELSPSLRTELVSFWDLDEESDGSGAVTRSDSHSTNHLTDTNTVTSVVPSDLSLGKNFEIQSSELVSTRGVGSSPALAVNLTLKETGSGVYDWNNGYETKVDVAPNTSLPNPTNVKTPTGLTLASGTDELYIRADGTIFSRIKVSWTSPVDPFVTSGGRIEIQYKLSANATWQNSTPVPGNTTEAYILDVKDSQNYDVRIRSINGIGNSSSWVQILQHQVLGKSELPSNVTGFVATISSFGITLTWSAVDDLDLKHYEIRSGNTWVETPATIVATLRGTSYQVGFKTVGTHNFVIKAVDTSNNKSASAPVATATIQAIPAPTNFTSKFEGANLVLTWDKVASQFAIEEYRITYGTTPGGEDKEVAIVKSDTYTLKIAWSGVRIFWIRAVDVAGNLGAYAGEQTEVIPPEEVGSLTSDVIDNNVFLRWVSPVENTLPIEIYRIYKGDLFSSASLIGTTIATFHARFELTADVYTYWIVAVDTGGNTSPHKGISATVAEPPDFILRNDNELEPLYAKTYNALVGIDVDRIVANFTAANSEYLSSADTTGLSSGDIDFTWVIRFRPTIIDASAHQLFQKYTSTGPTTGEYELAVNSSDKLEWAVTGGSTRTTVASDTWGVLTQDEWITAIVWHDSVNNKIHLQIENGTVEESAHSAGANDTAVAFEVGRAATPGSYFDGQISFLAFWKRLLTAPERERIFIMQSALSYESLDAAMLMSIAAAWNFNETTPDDAGEGSPVPVGGNPQGGLTEQVYDNFESGSIDGWWEVINSPTSPSYSYPSSLSGEKVCELQFDSDEDQNLTLGDSSLVGGTGVRAIQVRFWQSFKSDFHFPAALKLCRVSAPTNNLQVTIELSGNGTGSNVVNIACQLYHDAGLDKQSWSSYSITDKGKEVQYDLYINLDDGVVRFYVDGTLHNNHTDLTEPAPGAKFTSAWFGGNYSNGGTPPPVLAVSYIHRASIFY